MTLIKSGDKKQGPGVDTTKNGRHKFCFSGPTTVKEVCVGGGGGREFHLFSFLFSSRLANPIWFCLIMIHQVYNKSFLNTFMSFRFIFFFFLGGGG